MIHARLRLDVIVCSLSRRGQAGVVHDLQSSGKQMFEEYGMFGNEHSSGRVDAV